MMNDSPAAGARRRAVRALRARAARRERARVAVLSVPPVGDRSPLPEVSAAAGAGVRRFVAIRRETVSGLLALRGRMHTIEPARLAGGQDPAGSAGGSRRRRDERGSTAADPRPRADLLGQGEPARHQVARSSTRSTPIRSRPAPDCVSESLDTLDERWKAGSFRYLMPDFRARVHRGETFVIAGDRFAIGSSREMSPAGLKGVAEEVGRELVVVCGQQHGRHLPPQRLQPRPARRAEPGGGRRRAGRRRVHVRSADARAAQRDARARTTRRCRCRRRKRRSAAAAASSRSAGASSASRS